MICYYVFTDFFFFRYSVIENNCLVGFSFIEGIKKHTERSLLLAAGSVPYSLFIVDNDCQNIPYNEYNSTCTKS